MKELFKKTWTIFQSYALRVIFQAIYFVILARSFGAEKYGAYVGIIALISLFIPFASWGGDFLVIRSIARERSLFRDYYGRAILKTALFGVLFVLVVLGISRVVPIPKTSFQTIFYLALSNLVFMKLGDVCRGVFIGVDQLKYASLITFLLSFNRFLAAVSLLVFFDTPTLEDWSRLYCIATLTTTVVSTFLVAKHVGRPKFSAATLNKDLGVGLAFSVSASAENIYNDLDKSMLAKLSTLEAAGIYGAAYHILSVSLLPINSLMLASFRNFFQEGVNGIQGTFKLCKKLFPLSVGYSILAIIGILVFGPLLPKILGDEYASSLPALIWLSPVLFFRSMHFLGADILTGSNHQTTRSSFQVLIAIVNAVLNFWLIPRYSWYGAIWATLTSEALLMLFLWGAIYVHMRAVKS